MIKVKFIEPSSIKVKTSNEVVTVKEIEYIDVTHKMNEDGNVVFTEEEVKYLEDHPTCVLDFDSMIFRRMEAPIYQYVDIKHNRYYTIKIRSNDYIGECTSDDLIPTRAEDNSDGSIFDHTYFGCVYDESMQRFNVYVRADNVNLDIDLYKLITKSAVSGTISRVKIDFENHKNVDIRLYASQDVTYTNISETYPYSLIFFESFDGCAFLNHNSLSDKKLRCSSFSHYVSETNANRQVSLVNDDTCSINDFMFNVKLDEKGDVFINYSEVKK